MKHRTYVIVIFLLLFQIQIFGQENWDIYTFSNICSFRVPPTMELRNINAGNGRILNEAVNHFSIIFGQEPADKEIKFQPKGLNSSKKEDIVKATTVYSRILISDLEGECPSQTDIAKTTAADIKEIDAIFKKNAIESWHNINPSQKIVWFPLSKVTVDGKYALLSTYRRPSPKGGFVNVKEYKFFFSTHLLRITISYRENESSLWKQDFDKFINTLSFN